MIEGQTSPPAPIRHALQWVRLADGAVTARVTITGPFQLGGVEDDGVLLAQGPAMRARRLDPTRRSQRESQDVFPVPMVFHNASWLGPGRYVIGVRGLARVIDLDAQRWRELPWP